MVAGGRFGSLTRARVCLSKLGSSYRIGRPQPAYVCLSKLGASYRIGRLQPAYVCLSKLWERSRIERLTHSIENGTMRRSFVRTVSLRPSGGNARWWQSGRSQMRQLTPTGTAAPSRLSPSE